MENDVLTKAVEWYDPDTADTVRLACEERGLELLFLTPTEGNTRRSPSCAGLRTK